MAKSPDWSDEEDEMLEQVWGRETAMRPVCEALPGRTYGAIRSRASHIGLGSLGSYGAYAEQLEIALRDGPMSAMEMHRRLGVALSHTYYIADKLVAKHMARKVRGKDKSGRWLTLWELIPRQIEEGARGVREPLMAALYGSAV